jgi:hypothetical protein
MHINFYPEKVDWHELLGSMIEHEREKPVLFQTGYGTYSIFQGMPYQRGAGIGALFKSLFRFLLPIGKEVGAVIGQQGLESGTKILSNILEGHNIKETLRKEGKAGLKSLLEKAASQMVDDINISSPTSAEAQKGKGKILNAHSSSIKERMRNGKSKAKKSINKRRSIPNLFSKIEPPLFPTSTSFIPHNRKRKIPPKFKRLPKKVHFDELGPY